LRFGAALVAFAVAAAVAVHGPLLSEFLVQVRDPNLLGGPIFGFVLRHFGYAVVLGLCGALAAAAVLLVAWRTRERGASDWHATLAAAIAGLCLTPWFGVSLEPIGWVCAAATCLLLDRDDDTALLALIVIVLFWSLLQGGGTLGALLAICALAGRLLDDRRFTPAVRRRTIYACAAVLVGFPQLHELPWHAYGAHALYLDGLRNGASRDVIWNGSITPAALGFCAIVIVAGWYGLRRRNRIGDAIAFFALLLLALVDARNLPYFAIAATAPAVDALASFYVSSRVLPRGSTLGYSRTFLAFALLFMAFLAVTEPKAVIWPSASQQPAALLAQLRSEPGEHRLLCTQPRWCDGVDVIVRGTSVIADDRTGWMTRNALRVNRDVARTSGRWRSELRSERIDRVIADDDDGVVTLLQACGWKTTAADGSRVLLARQAIGDCS
jgi:hypothetical protein